MKYILHSETTNTSDQVARGSRRDGEREELRTRELPYLYEASNDTDEESARRHPPNHHAAIPDPSATDTVVFRQPFLLCGWLVASWRTKESA